MYGLDAEEMMRDYCKGTGEKSDLNGEDSGCGHTRGCRGRCNNINKLSMERDVSLFIRVWVYSIVLMEGLTCIVER